MKVLVTGGAGFIGSAFVRHLLHHGGYAVINVDRLSYAGSLDALAEVADSPRHTFVRQDVCDTAALHALFAAHRPQAVVHLAAESHVDRSIDGPLAFVRNNVLGTASVLEAARRHWQGLQGPARAAFRFVHVSTDEVYGALAADAPGAREGAAYAPSSPYSASKAGADHLVHAWWRTYGLPTLVTHSTNNYGPHQFAEKLIPLMTLNALEGRPLPVYGDGTQVRDWLHVDDHARALRCVLEHGTPGETYHVAGGCARRNLDVVHAICAALEALAPQHPSGVAHYAQLIRQVADRPGHDARYAIDARKIATALGWHAQIDFDHGLRETVRWIVAHHGWYVRTQGDARRRRGLLAPPAP